MTGGSSSPWSFQGPPTVAELAIAALAAVTAVSGLSIAESIAWGWAAVGVVLVVVSLGPVKSYTVATGASARFGEFYDAIGLVGRLVVVVAVAGVLLWVVGLEAIPGSSVFSLGNGGLLAVAGVVAIKWIRHREIA